MGQPMINEKVFLNQPLISQASEAFQSKSQFNSEHLKIISNPFPLCVIQDAFQDSFLHSLKSSLLEQPFGRKSNDLYSFVQTKDLKGCQDPFLSQFREIIYSPQMIAFVSSLVGIPLSSSVIDLAGQQYFPGDYLLCHDDRLDSRKIAFICYLVDPDGWDEEDGGSLDLFHSLPQQDKPTSEIGYQLFPKWNHFAFFEVTKKSFHQVAENISSKGRIRISIAGWYHSILNDNEQELKIPICRIESKDHLLASYWINPMYLDSSNLDSILSHFDNNSSVSLSNFLIPFQYEKIQQELGDKSCELKQVYSPLNYRYSQIESNRGEIGRFLEFLSNPNCNLFFNNLFGDSFSGWKLESFFNQFFTHRSFVLANDEDYWRGERMDVEFFITPPTLSQMWQEEWGGSTFYIGNNVSLLELIPSGNTISFVYTSEEDGEISKFTKYLNHKSKSWFFKLALNYSLSLVD